FAGDLQRERALNEYGKSMRSLQRRHAFAVSPTLRCLTAGAAKAWHPPRGYRFAQLCLPNCFSTWTTLSPASFLAFTSPPALRSIANIFFEHTDDAAMCIAVLPQF